VGSLLTQWQTIAGPITSRAVSATNAPTASVAVVNMGIGGNGFLRTRPGRSARFDRDVLNQNGVRWLSSSRGNDIGEPLPPGAWRYDKLD